MKDQKTVVILLSDKRSGSTMFQRELCKHPDIQTVSYSPHTYLETHHWLKAAVMLDLDPSLFCGGQVYQGYGSKHNARTYLEDCIRGNIPEFILPESDRELIFRGWEALCDRFAQSVFFEKSPQFLAHWGCLELILEWIRSTEYQVKIIGLVRNPLSVLYSAQELFHTNPETRQYGWLEIHQNLLQFQKELSPESFLMCRYEDIIRQPEQAFNQICRFISVSENHNIGADVHVKSVNKWETDPYFTIQLSDEVKHIAEKFDYTKPELTNPIKPPPPFLHQVMRRIEATYHLSIARLKNRVIHPIRLRHKTY